MIKNFFRVLGELFDIIVTPQKFVAFTAHADAVEKAGIAPSRDT